MNEFDRNWKSVFNRLAKEHQTPEGKAGYESARLFKSREDLIVLLLDEIKQGQRCLDIGCNSGYFTAMIQKHCGNTTGLDFSEIPLQQAQESFPEISFIQGSAVDLPFQDEVFDVTCCFGLLQVLQDWHQVLDEMHRVLKPGGIALLEFNRKQPYWLSVVRALMTLIRGQAPPKKVMADLWFLLDLKKEHNPLVDSKYFSLHEISSAARDRGWVGVQTVSVPGATFYSPGWIAGAVLRKASL